MFNSNIINPLGQSEFAAQKVAYTTEQHTNDYGSGPSSVLVWCSTDAYVEVGSAAVATAGSTPIPAGVPMVFKVPNGNNPWRVSAFQVATGGNLFVKPVNVV